MKENKSHRSKKSNVYLITHKTTGTVFTVVASSPSQAFRRMEKMLNTP
jgi:hypothetical protein